MKITFEDEGTRLVNLAAGDTFKHFNDIYFVTNANIIDGVATILASLSEDIHDSLMEVLEGYSRGGKLDSAEIVCINLKDGEIVTFYDYDIVTPVETICTVRETT